MNFPITISIGRIGRDFSIHRFFISFKKEFILGDKEKMNSKSKKSTMNTLMSIIIMRVVSGNFIVSFIRKIAMDAVTPTRK